mmetsp:Transcript_34201/g.56635  ORF Transcript_34201/g.56635 Transcript_34201/m.56635 type:complete len:105 (+) Transcript_34201:137-451(+)
MEQALREALRLIELGRIVPPPSGCAARAGGNIEICLQYHEYMLWPRDADTGKRSGFPGRDLWQPPLTSDGAHVRARHHEQRHRSKSTMYKLGCLRDPWRVPPSR